MKNFKSKTIYIFTIALILASGFFGLNIAIKSNITNKAFASTTDGMIDLTDKYAWSENLGWINFGTTEGNVHITDSELTGYAWSENAGWISLNCSNNSSCATVDHKIANDGAGNLSGYAWSENTGWINFNPSVGGVSINSSGEFLGYAWGENIGWIVFNCATTSSCATVDYKVKTDWRSQVSRPQCNNSLDDDGDGLTDYPNDLGCSSLTDDDETNSGGSFVYSPPPIVPSQSFQIIMINDQLTIDFGNVENVYQMAISTTPDFEYISWEPYQEAIVLSDANKRYIKFRSQSGGVSEVYEAETDSEDKIDLEINNFSNGSLIRAINGFKVYIINNNYIRHIPDGKIFDFYGHLNWNAIQEVDFSIVNSYQESSLIRADNDYKVYKIIDKKKHWLNITVKEFVDLGYSWDDVYITNKEELKWYEG
ncbi:MAG: hypothetical protein U9N04_00700 [Patescibacteria group bacterium]|nr:hypothetical protein [Patescibacteria group bacterium]